MPPAGGVTAERLASFMKVRAGLVPLCDNFTEIGEKFRKMDELAKEDGEKASKREIFGAVGDIMGAVFGISGNIGRFTQDRNAVLLAEKMGLGEYIWIYTLVYNSWLGHEPNVDFNSLAGGCYDAKDQELIRKLMRHHAEALTVAGRSKEAQLWLDEATHLERTDGSGVPWGDSEIPAAMAEFFEPYRDQLEDLYCEASSPFEFSQVHKRGLSIQAD